MKIEINKKRGEWNMHKTKGQLAVAVIIMDASARYPHITDAAAHRAA